MSAADDPKINDMRLMRLEEEQSDTAQTVAGHGEAIRFISKSLDELQPRIEASFAAVIDPMREDLRLVGERVVAMGDRVGEHDVFIGKLQAERKAHADRKDNWRKAFVTILTGAVAIFAKEGATWLLKHWH